MTSSQRLRFWLIGLAVLIFLLYALRGMLLPFVAGMAIAYFLDPLAKRLHHLGLPRIAAAALISVSFFVVLGVALTFLLPVIEEQVLSFAHRVPDYVDALSNRIDPLARELMKRLSPNDVERLRSSLGGYAGTMVSWALDVVRGLLRGGLAVVNLLALLFITPVVTFYLLKDWNQLVTRIDSWLPRPHAPVIRAQLAEIDRTLSAFVRGQATVCLALSAFYAVALTVIGVDLGLVIGLASGLLSFVPYLGTVIGLPIAVAVGLAKTGDWMLPGLAALVYLAGNLLEGNALTPNLVGDRIGLHPVWILFSVLAGAWLVGFLGVLLAVPVAAMTGVLVRFALARYLDSSLYRGNSGT